MGWHPPPHAGATALVEQAAFCRAPAWGAVPSAPADGLRVRAAPAALWPPRRHRPAGQALVPPSCPPALSHASPVFSHCVLSSCLPCSLMAFSCVLPCSLMVFSCVLLCSHDVLPCSLIVFSHVSPVFSPGVLLCFFVFSHSVLPCSLIVSPVFTHRVLSWCPPVFSQRFSRVHSSFLPCSLVMFSHVLSRCSPMFSHHVSRVLTSFLPCSLVLSYGVLLCSLMFP